MIRIQTPGTWNEYVKNNGHLKIPINELKQRYFKQLSLFENQQQLYRIQQMMLNDTLGGGSIVDTTIVDNTINEFVENDYVEDYFI
jgi:glutaminase